MISIIVPIYNSSQYIDRCIASVLSQTYESFELLLIDDGSTDDSYACCEKWRTRDKRIILKQQKNSGVSVARNRGLADAKGHYILLLDSDDWLASNTLEILVDVQSQNNADCIIFGFNQTSGNIWAPKDNFIYNSIEDFKKDFSYHINTELLSSSVNKL